MKLVHWPFGGWAVIFGTPRRGPAQARPRCTKCNSLPISGQCINHHIAV